MSTTRRTSTASGTLGLTQLLLLVVAVVALIAGPAYWINGLTQVQAPVHVPVQYDGTRDGVAPPAYEYTLDAVVLPLLASSRVLDRLGVAVPGGPLRSPAVDLDPTPLLLIGLLMALAEAFRHGERLARETDGLV